MSRIDAHDSRLDNVLARYALTAPCVLALIEASDRNENFIVGTADGTRYVLRRYRRNQDERRVAFQIRFQRHLHHRGFPTANVIPSAVGTDYVVINGMPWAVFEFIDGQEYNFARVEQAVEAGRRLAQFHLAAASFAGDEIVVDWGGGFRSFWMRDGEEAELPRLFAGKGVEGELAFRLGWWQAVYQAWPIERVEALPYGWVHGDYHGRNVMFIGDRMAGLFDFDVVWRGPLALDVAYGLVMFGRERRGSVRLRVETAKAFLAAYEESRRLSREERQALPVLVLANRAASAALFRYRARDGDDVCAVLRKSVAFIRELSPQLRHLAPTFGWSPPP